MTDARCHDLPDVAISPLDRDLIRLLSQDARRSNTELAGLLKVSRTTIKNRIARLVDLGVIERFTIKLAGKDHGGPPEESAFFHMKLKRPFCRMVYESVRGWPELTGAWSIAGGTDMTLLVQCKGLDRLEDLRDRLARHPEVEVVWTAMVLRQWSLKSSMNRDYEPGDGPDRLDLRLEEIVAEDRRRDISDGLVQAR